MRPSLSIVDGSIEIFDMLLANLSKLYSTPTASAKKQLGKSDKRELGESVRELCSQIGVFSFKLKIIASTQAPGRRWAL